MSWKIAKKNHANASVLKHPRRWSITSRLTWVYTVSVFFVLTFATFALYWIYTNRLENQNLLFLKNKMTTIQALLKNEFSHPAFFAEEMQEEVVLEPKLYRYYVRVIDKNKKILFETPGMQNIIPITTLGSPGLDNHEVINWTSTQKNHHQKYFLLMTNLSSAQHDRVIQIAKDISGEQALIAEYRRSLIIILLLGVLGSATLSAIVTYRGLKPLRDMTQSTQRVNVAQLKERLDPTDWPEELSKLAFSFNEMLDRIEEGVNRLSQFSGDLAHELRTPVNNLMGEAEIALSKPRHKHEYREVIESSVEELAHISQIIENLLFLARAKNPASVVQLAVLSLKPILEEIQSLYEAAAEEKNIQLHAEGHAQIVADPLMLRRALSNLVYNALQHTPPGGLITISTKTIKQATHIFVRDNGEGIAPEHLPHVFHRFYRADSARSKKTGGTGLGLAIVHSIMLLHKGQVKIDSALGKGTTVTLIFPPKDI